MKRRNADCGKIRRPIKRNKITESSNTLLYMKFLILWAFVITADFMLEFRFEFLWPFWLLLRSVHDSFKYKGLTFAALFVCIAITSDLICLFFIPVHWLFFAASTYVWVQFVWHTDKGVCLPTIILWMMFVYLEAAIRWKDNRHMPHLDLCRPFAAHCIGYPVVTLGFGFKSYVGYLMRIRKQREVAKENEFYMQLLQQALPQQPVDENSFGVGTDAETSTPNGNLANSILTLNGDISCGDLIKDLIASTTSLVSSASSLSKQQNHHQMNSSATAVTPAPAAANNTNNLNATNNNNNVNAQNNSNSGSGVGGSTSSSGNNNNIHHSNSSSSNHHHNKMLSLGSNNSNSNNSSSASSSSVVASLALNGNAISVQNHHSHHHHISNGISNNIGSAGNHHNKTGAALAAATQLQATTQNRRSGSLHNHGESGLDKETAIGPNKCDSHVISNYSHSSNNTQSSSGSKSPYQAPGVATAMAVTGTTVIATSKAVTTNAVLGSSPFATYNDNSTTAMALESSTVTASLVLAANGKEMSSVTLCNSYDAKDPALQALINNAGDRKSSAATTNPMDLSTNALLIQNGIGGQSSHHGMESRKMNGMLTNADDGKCVSAGELSSTVSQIVQNDRSKGGKKNRSKHKQEAAALAAAIESSTVCTSCSRLEQEVKRLKVDVSHVKQIENELRQRVETNANLKSGLQAKHREIDELEKKIQDLNNLQQSDRQNLANVERKLGEERRKKMALESQLVQEQKLRNKAEEKASKWVDCDGTCKAKARFLETEYNNMRRERNAMEEKKKSFEQQNRNYEIEMQKLKNERRCRESEDRLMTALAALQEKNYTLEKSLSEETRVKLDLFSALGVAKRELEGKESELSDLRSKVAQMLAILPVIPTSEGMMGSMGYPHHLQQQSPNTSSSSSLGSSMMQLSESGAASLSLLVMATAADAHNDVNNSVQQQQHHMTNGGCVDLHRSPGMVGGAGLHHLHQQQQHHHQQQQQQFLQQQQQLQVGPGSGNSSSASSTLDPNATAYTPALGNGHSAAEVA